MSSYSQHQLNGLEVSLSEIELAVQQSCHDFARDVMRPAGMRLDKLSAAEVIAEDSEFWDVIDKSKGLGISLTAMIDLQPLERVRILCLALEELAWGDCGLACQMLTSSLPVMISLMAGNMEMAHLCEGKLGCWSITEPDHANSILDANFTQIHSAASCGQTNCVAKIVGDKVVVNGQKSSWISGACIAQVCALFCHAEIEGANGKELRPGISIIIPLDLEGVSRGQPLERMGVRTLNQTQLFFDNVKVPIKNLLIGPKEYQDFSYRVVSEASPLAAIAWLGNARAAYDYTLQYVRQRRKSGIKILNNQSMKIRLFHMFRKIEASRALIRRAIEYNAIADMPALQGSTAAKVTAAQLGFEVCSDALQMFGDNGLKKKYPMEKLLRDARAGMIIDGCNEVLP